MRSDPSSPQGLPLAEEEALAWFVRNQGQDAPDPAFEAWCAVDPAHEAAYARVSALWGSDAFGAAARRLKRPARPVAAAIVLPLALLLTMGGLKATGVTPSLPADHVTRVGDVATTTLDDGTRLTLDTATAVDVDFDAGERVLRLRRGRVFVAVAADARPFRIVADGADIRDIGTSFSVREADGGARVAVRDGIVDVRATGHDKVQRLTAGLRGGVSREGLLPITAADSYEDFGWTRDRLYFHDRPLGEVVAELRRYYRGWIVVGDEAIANQRISGGLRLDDPASAMAELAKLSGGKLTRVSDTLLILR